MLTVPNKTQFKFNNANVLVERNLTVQDSIKGNDYYSGDGTKGMTNSTGFWMCTDSTCIAKCQVTIKDGLITSCA